MTVQELYDYAISHSLLNTQIGEVIALIINEQFKTSSAEYSNRSTEGVLRLFSS